MLKDDFISALSLLSKVMREYEIKTGAKAVLVGGAVATLYTLGTFASGDFDIIAHDTKTFDEVMEHHGFIKENRKGFLRVGFYHPEHLEFGFQLVSGLLFDGHTPSDKIISYTFSDGYYVNLPPIEDMIADRLAQHEVSAPSDDSRLLQAQEMYECFKERIDLDYLKKRVNEECGDISLLTIDTGEHNNDEFKP